MLLWCGHLSLDKDTMNRMSDLLRSGATMTAEHCPACNSPLFKVGGQLRCPRCNKPVIIVKEGEEEKTVVSMTTLSDLEETLLGRLNECNLDLKEEKNPTRVVEIGTALNLWLSALERVRRIQRNT